MGLKKIDRLWAFDFDGTISNLVPDRETARLQESCAIVLEKLARVKEYCVAVLSSRMLEDLIPRIEIPGVFLGGGNGITWKFPGGERKQKPGKKEKLRAGRNALLPKIKILEKYPGVEIEDKKWSVAVHLRKASAPVKSEVGMILEEVAPFRGIRKYSGPEVIEIPILPEIDKAFGLNSLCGFLDYDPGPGELVYAGDSENDIPAMQWVLFLKGTVFTVGETPLVPGSNLAVSPDNLAESILKCAFEDKIAVKKST